MTEPPVKAPGKPRGGKVGRWVSARVGPRGYRVDVEAGAHTFVIDEPVSVGGSDTGATPYDHLLGALGGCMAITLRMYADRKQWPLEGVRVQLRTTRAHASDCESCETQSVGLATIERHIELAGPLTDEQRERLLYVAGRCPVKQTLERGIRMHAE
jgi:putative redox protein